MDLHQIRYLFEHKLLPLWFFEDKDKLLGALLQDKDMLFKIINNIFEKEGVENPYSKEQFSVLPKRVAEDVMALKISFPEPEQEPLCYCCYLFFDKEFAKLRYYCVEKGQEVYGGERVVYPFICSWTQDGGHLNHGNCAMVDDGDFKRCVELYKNEQTNV